MTQLVAIEQDAQNSIVSTEGAGQYLTFQLAKEIYAVSIANVKEIIEYGQITNVPMMPEFVRGVINLRGSVVPVVDLQVRLGRESSPVTKRTCVVIFEVIIDDNNTHETIGMLVDSVSEVLSISGDGIENAPQFGANLRQDFISGLAKIDDKFVIILNADKVLSVEEISGLVQSLEDSTGTH